MTSVEQDFGTDNFKISYDGGKRGAQGPMAAGWLANIWQGERISKFDMMVDNVEQKDWCRLVE